MRLTKTRGRATRRTVVVAAAAVALAALPAHGQQMAIGGGTIPPGMVVSVAATAPDHILPSSLHLAGNRAELYLAARVNWGSAADEIPPGTPPGGFVAYLSVHAEIASNLTGKRTLVTLLPHIGADTGVHYGRNISLPGGPGEAYSVTVRIDPPDPFKLSTHRDWRDRHESHSLCPPSEFTYENVEFGEVLSAP